MGAGKYDEAALQFAEALKRMPDNAILRNNLGVAFAREGRLEAAIDQFRQAIRIRSDYPKPYLNCAVAWQKLGQNAEAFTNFTVALQIDPRWPEALDKAACFFATCPELRWRNTSEAVKLSARANELTRDEFPGYLETLAMTYAAAGNFSNAIATAELAERKARAGNLRELADEIAGELKAYQAFQVPQMSNAVRFLHETSVDAAKP